mgnify:CR=1 FL=1
MANIKIFVTYKTRKEIIQSDIITPIQSGRAIADEIFEDMIGDDTGDNISEKNCKYSELSAVYWVWKNYRKIGNPDYVGFMHYRRQFVFDERLALPYPKWISSYYYVSNQKEASSFFSDEAIMNLVPKYDYIIPKYHVVPNGKNIREEYIHNISGSKDYIFDEFIKVCRQIHPDWEEEIHKIETGNIVSVCNMFIMNRKLFFDYCEFVFPVLSELEKRVDATNLTENGLRFLGYMAEKLQTMYTMRLEKNKNLKEKFCNCLFVRKDIRKNDICYVNQSLYNNVMIKNALNLGRNKLKYWRYKLLSKITFGKKRKKYKEKRKKVKTLIKQTKQFLKGIK